jgi:hypothetical protein
MSRLLYEVLCQVDDVMRAIRKDAPTWMKDDHVDLPAGSPPWVDWQRKAYMVRPVKSRLILSYPLLTG